MSAGRTCAAAPPGATLRWRGGRAPGARPHCELTATRFPRNEQPQGLAHRGGDFRLKLRQLGFLHRLQRNVDALLQAGTRCDPLADSGVAGEADFDAVLEGGQ
ncbi:hypothetical protein [Kineobactrum salinum]|uniref:hypothetical protein n=1 Tax=Kineobactrum salinum TaxID=2708301 RepID=UPI001E348E42|nr:hypothetical protein [Kineobactrum salinum]